MALSLHSIADSLRLVVAYEDGRLAVFTSDKPSIWSTVREGENEGWKLIWHGKGHSEPSWSDSYTAIQGTDTLHSYEHDYSA